MSDLLCGLCMSFFKLQEKRAEIEGMMDAIFKGVFLKRYR